MRVSRIRVVVVRLWGSMGYVYVMTYLIYIEDAGHVNPIVKIHAHPLIGIDDSHKEVR